MTVAASAAIMLCLLMLTGCSSANGAEKKVAKELDALSRSDSVGSEVVNLRESLSKEGREDFDEFLDKLRDFDYEVTGSKAGDDPEADYTEVYVRIRTYDFGREYLAAWTEYLKSHGDGLDENSDMTDFYELLFDRLSDLDEKDCIRDISIVCIDPLDNGEWIANIKENEELQDAVFGGMMTEMKTLAAE